MSLHGQYWCCSHLASTQTEYRRHNQGYPIDRIFRELYNVLYLLHTFGLLVAPAFRDIMFNALNISGILRVRTT